MAADKVEYVDGELEAMLLNIDLMHNESRDQTIARLEAAVKLAKSGPAVPSLATRTEVVTREVTVPTAAQVEADKRAATEAKAVAAPKPAPKARQSRKARAKVVNKQVIPAKAAE